jgi:hypothetical protein
LLYFISKGLTDAIIGGGGESDLWPASIKMGHFTGEN